MYIYGQGPSYILTHKPWWNRLSNHYRNPSCRPDEYTGGQNEASTNPTDRTYTCPDTPHLRPSYRAGVFSMSTQAMGSTAPRWWAYAFQYPTSAEGQLFTDRLKKLAVDQGYCTQSDASTRPEAACYPQQMGSTNAGAEFWKLREQCEQTDRTDKWARDPTPGMCSDKNAAHYTPCDVLGFRIDGETGIVEYLKNDVVVGTCPYFMDNPGSSPVLKAGIQLGKSWTNGVKVLDSRWGEWELHPEHYTNSKCGLRTEPEEWNRADEDAKPGPQIANCKTISGTACTLCETGFHLAPDAMSCVACGNAQAGAYQCSVNQYKTGTACSGATSSDTQTCSECSNSLGIGSSDKYQCSVGHFKTGTSCDGTGVADTQSCSVCMFGGAEYDCDAGSFKSGSKCSGTTAVDTQVCQACNHNSASGDFVCPSGYVSDLENIPKVNHVGLPPACYGVRSLTPQADGRPFYFNVGGTSWNSAAFATILHVHDFTLFCKDAHGHMHTAEVQASAGHRDECATFGWQALTFEECKAAVEPRACDGSLPIDTQRCHPAQIPNCVQQEGNQCRECDDGYAPFVNPDLGDTQISFSECRCTNGETCGSTIHGLGDALRQAAAAIATDPKLRYPGSVGTCTMLGQLNQTLAAIVDRH